MATISNTTKPGYVWDSTDNVWYPLGVGSHGHPDYTTAGQVTTTVNAAIQEAQILTIMQAQ